MSKNSILRSLLVFIGGIIFVSIIFGLSSAHKFYVNIFRLSPDQFSSSLYNKKSKSKKISDCTLLPGDILIRRYITERTWLVDKLAHPYFTHSAFYLGDDQIVEAVGTEKTPEDEIQIAILSKSDWLYVDVENFVIIRPQKYTATKLNIIKNNLINIAKDPDYKFGLPESGYKRATCADLIFRQLLSESVINVSNAPEIITPDYLFSLAIKNPFNFNIVGYSISK